MTDVVHDHEWWVPYVDEYLQSNETIKNYCQEKGFNYDAFYWHLQRERQIREECHLSEIAEVLPVTVVNHPLDNVTVEINGIKVSGNPADVRQLLGIC